MTWIKLILLVGLVIVVRFYVRSPRSTLRDRLIVIPLALLLAAAVIYPELTSGVADLVGVGRGVDLAFYLGFLLIYFIVGMLRTQLTEQERKITSLVRELALLRASAPGPGSQSRVPEVEDAPSHDRSGTDNE